MPIRRYLKLGLGIGLALALAAGARVTWKAGYNAAQAKAAVAYEKQIEAARLEWERASEVAREQILNEQRIAQRTQAINAAIPAAVEGVPAECRDLGPDVMRLFNDAIDSGGASNVAGSAQPSD